MNERDDHTFALLEAANPVAADDLRRELGEPGLDAARARADRRLELTGDTAAPSRPGPTAGRSWSRRRLRLAGAAAACLVAGVAALAALPEGDGRLSTLDAVAAVAAGRPAPQTPVGSYTHVRERQGGRFEPWPTGLIAGPLPSTREFWIGPDGSGRVIRTTSAATGETPTGDGWKRTGDTWTNDQRFGAGRFPTVYRRVSPGVLDLRVDTLPTEPNALAALLRQELAEAAADDDPETGFAGSPDASSGELLIVIGQTLAHPLARPELRSALYEVAGTLEGVQVDEHGHDPSGRPAAVVSLDETATAKRSELFFDPRTSALLAIQSTTVELVPAGPIATPDPPGGRPLPTPDPARTQPADPDASDCGTVEDPCPATVAPMPRSDGDNEPDVRTTFTYFTIYDQRGTVDSMHTRP